MKRYILFIIVLFSIVSITFGQESEPDYLCFEVTEGTKIKLTSTNNTFPNCNYKSVNVEYSYDKVNWYKLGQSAITVSKDCFVYLRGNNTAFFDPNLSNIYQPSYRAGFYVSKPFKCSGNIMTLIDKTGEITTLEKYAFVGLFSECPILTAPKLPATSLSYRCYASMFRGCTRLVSAPVLPALELANDCYNGMFLGCTSLVNAPDLPATKLAKECYASMFYGCTSLRKAPKIKRFSQYADISYYQMFVGCTNLNYISVEFTQWYTAGSTNSLITQYWVQNVAQSGTFICPRGLAKKYDDDHIPKGWNVKYLEDLYSITIPESSQPYITIAQTTEIDAGEEIAFSVTDRTSEGSNATVTVEGINPIQTTQSGNDYVFTMPEEDVTISVSYSPITYSITTDAYSSAVAEASAGETVNVTFTNREGYNLTSATYNGNALTISDNAASFTMPAEAVTIATTYTPIDYDITSDQYATPSKNPANVGDVITVTFVKRDGYNLTSATYNDNPLTITNGTASFTMPAEAVTIATTYTPINYSITSDDYATPSKNTANVGDVINVTFANREGYNLTSATYNDNPLTIINGTASFTMPAAAVSIATTYTPINYTINKGDYIDVDKTTATINDKVTITVTDRTAQGYQLTKVLANTTEVAITNYIGEIDMKDYLTDVNITAEYSKIEYYLYYEAYARPQPQRLTAYVGDVINLIIANRPGYELYSVTYNDIELTFADFKASFVMPAANVTIKTKYRPIIYNIICADDNVSVDKSTAVVLNTVSINVVDRTAQGYQLTKVLANTTEVPITDFKGEIEMKYYVCDVTISAEYKKIGYAITSDNYATPNKTTANVGDEITVDFATRPGYNLTSATYNSNALTISNNKATFTMPPAAVNIITTYTPINYTINKGDFVDVDKTTATINDKVTITVTDRRNDGYQLTKVLANANEVAITNFKGEIDMKDYLSDVTITAEYSKIDYTITPDQYATPSKTTANIGDVINVTFANRDGYNLTSATYNDNPLTITNGAASFTMPAANVTIATVYSPIVYNITTDQYITVDKSTATINDQVSFTVADRTNDGYKLDKVLVNNTVFSGTSFNMADYLKDVTITAVYTKNSNPIVEYSITNDEFSTTDKASANEGDVINVTFTNRVGYILTSASYNGTELTITDNSAQFTMPAANATIATNYSLIEYKVTAGEFVTVDKTKATINDQVSFTVEDRSKDGYKLDKVLVNNTEFSGTSFNMADYLMDVTITAQYSKIGYTITTDAYSSTNKTTANVGDVINVTFKNRDGYNLKSATYNGTTLTITNNATQFTMPAANVTIATTHTPIKYNITAGEFVTVDKTKATINDQVSFTVADRTNDGYKLDKVLVNNTDFSGTSFNMADYLKDVTITAQYSKIGYTITTDDYSSTDKTTANVGDVVNVTFKDIAGYNLTSATYNGTELTITNGAAQFTMPAANVTIATTHTLIEYKITTGEFVTVDKTKATINDQVSFTVADRTNNGYKLDKVLVNNTEFSGRSFNMADYLKDVTITAVYSNNSNPVVEYTITNDEFSTTDKASANEGDVINVTFTNRVGYILTSASYNGTELTITDNSAHFTMPAANVTIATTHTPIEYKITAGEFVTVDKTKATINDQVSFTVADRTNDGYKLDKVLVNNTEFTGTSFNMADYLKDVTITAVYTKNSNPVVEYSITNDEFSTTDKASANEGDVITVTFTNRDGYNLTAATYNGTPLNISNNAAQFTMPAANVTIATTYKPIKNDNLLIVDDIIVEADGYCAGDVLRLSFKTTCKKGKYQIMFSERAKAEGFVDLDFAYIEDSERQTAMFDIPQSTNYGNYQGFIRVVDVDGNEGAAFPFGFNIDYPNDIIETKYADLICVNNFSHNYVAYQWMKNGKEIAGANKQFYIDYPALNGVYNVIVTDKNGNKFKVCDFRAAELKTKSAPKPSVNVYPNPALSMQPITIELVGVDISEKCEIMLYTHSGALVQKISDAKTLNVVYLKSGIYTGVVVINGKKLTFKLIVNE